VAFAYREPIVATVFSFLGLFYAWFGLTNLIFLGGTTEKMVAVSAVSMGMVFFDLLGSPSIVRFIQPLRCA
jgi:hypothetical protein